MPYIRKDKAGSCPGHTWEHDGDVVEVDDVNLVADLLAIPGFSEVAPPHAPEAGGDPDHDEAAPPKRGRPRKTAQSQTEVSE